MRIESFPDNLITAMALIPWADARAMIVSSTGEMEDMCAR
jgi:hypothetical protein